MVPLTIVPANHLGLMSRGSPNWYEDRVEVAQSRGSAPAGERESRNIERLRTVLELDCDSLVLALHQKPARNR